MTSFLTKANNISSCDKEPFILIDMSGSTTSECCITKYLNPNPNPNQNFDYDSDSSSSSSSSSNLNSNSNSNSNPTNNQTILDSEYDVAIDILEKNDINKCHLILWNTTVHLCEKVDINYLKSNRVESKGGTALNCALKKVIEIYKQNDLKNKDMYIITDGEIQDQHEIGKYLSDLFNDGINIYILTTEPNNKNYYSSNCYAGNALYNYLKSNSKMNFVKKITQYNNFHKLHEEFTALYNFNVPENYLPFRDSVFHESNFNKFTKFLKEEIEKCSSNEMILKLAHELSRTIFYMTKNKESILRQMIVNNISDYFKTTNVYSQIRDLLLKEIDNHANNKSSTFQDYRTNRNKLFEKSQMNLLDNTKLSITNGTSNSYVSFVCNNHVINFTEKMVIENINLGKLSYKNAGAKINNLTLPVFPANVDVQNNTDALNQCMRQWVRANYSYMYKLNVSSGKILCQYLIDMLNVNLSDKISQETKKCYKNLSYIMFNAKTYGTDTEIIKELENKKSLSNYEYFSKFGLKSGVTWYAILLTLDNQSLLESQKEIYKENVVEFVGNENFDKVEFMNKFKESYVFEQIQEITLKEKYSLPEHEIYDTISCENKYIPNFDENEEFTKCPVCKKEIKVSEIIKNDIININDIQIASDIYSNNKHEEVKLEIYQDDKLLSIDNLNFDLVSYDIKNVCMVDVLNTTKLLVKTKEKFIEKVNRRYPFMENLNMQNVCLAGGFPRSILLGSKMKDFDFFIYGVEDYIERMKTLVSDLIDNINKTKLETDKFKFLYMYKPLFNVFEIVVADDPNDHFDNNFMIDNFDKYKYMSLKQYDKKHEVKQDEYYFEDGDKKGIKIKYRFQFIMAKFNSIKHVLDGFDLFPSCVAYTGEDVLFTQNSYIAYKYMVNIVRNDSYSYLFDSRMGKYLSYGFDFVFPEDKISDINDFKTKFKAFNNNVQLGSLKFDISKVLENKIIIDHDSHKKELIESLSQLEKNCKEEGKTGYYKSSLFCSMVSLIRYMCINKLHYIFSSDKILPDENNVIKFKNGNETLHFIDKIEVLREENKWYTDNTYVPPKNMTRELLDLQIAWNNIANISDINIEFDNNDVEPLKTPQEIKKIIKKNSKKNSKKKSKNTHIKNVVKNIKKA